MHDEFEWIKSITPKHTYQSSLAVGIGDDAAVYHGNSDSEEIICMDTMVEDIHFNRKTMRPYHIGHKALASNISDIAAMGGYPLFYLVSISIPNDWHVDEINEIYKGMNNLADKYNMDLIGGDTVSTKKYLSVTVTVIGRSKKGKYVLRSSAKPGDIVFVTGNLGDSSCGLSLLLERGIDGSFTSEELNLVKEHQLPIPMVHCAQLLQESGARLSLNDISDGLASEANELAEASGVTIELDYNFIPVSNYINKFPPLEQIQWTLYGGEDYQLVGTVSSEHWDMIKQISTKRNIMITKIGFVTEGEPSVYIHINGEKRFLEKKGYNHFKK